ncbi:unnamed protein product [Jaminaea pallidilutea]
MLVALFEWPVHNVTSAADETPDKRMSQPQQKAPPNMEAWRVAVTRRIFSVTLDRDEAERSNWSIVYLKELADELKAESQLLDPSIADRVIIARLSLDPQGSNAADDPDTLTVLASLDEDETSWDWLINSWKRCEKEKAKAKKGLGDHVPEALSLLNGAQELIVSYAGLVLITPDMFPGDTKRSGAKLTPAALVPSILSITGATDSLQGSSSSARWAALDQSEAPVFLSGLCGRFDMEELEQIIGPAVTEMSRRIRDGLEEHGGQPSSNAAGVNGGVQGNGTNNAAMQAAAQAGDVRAVLAQLLGGQGAAAGGGAAEMDPFGRPVAPNAATKGMHIGAFEWRGYVLPLMELLDLDKQIATGITQLANFNPAEVKAPRMELDSVLGPVLRLSTFTDVSSLLTEQYFSTPSARSKSELESNYLSMRSTLSLLHGFHFRIFQSLIKSSPTARENVLQYWGHIVDVNRRRGAMRVRKDQVSSDGFTVNIWETLQRFAVPFMDAQYSKIDRIDPAYLRRQKRYDTSTLTRLNASEAEAKGWADSAADVDAQPNFITEVFFLVLRMTNLGPGKAIRSHGEREEDIRRMNRKVKETEELRSTWASTPQAPQYEAYIKRAQAEVDKMSAENHASATQLLDDGFIDRLVHLTGFTMTWLVRLADPRAQHPHQTVSLPLPQEVPENFRMLPEHIFEDICDILLFLARHKPTCLPEAVKNDFVTFAITFLSSGWFIRNPFLKAKLAEIMWWNSIPYGYSQTGILGDIINLHPLALDHLVPACMSFWVEAESTGSHTQFYDKFNIRYHLSQIFKVIWSNPRHMDRIQAEAKGNSDKFVVFINRLMNDVTFLLDDALEKLLDLHRKQQQMDDTATWNERPAEERQEIEGHVQSTQGQIRSMLQFGKEFLRLLIDFTAQTKDAFMTVEIVSRLAAMLDYNLDLLVGPRCTELKIKDPQRVHFEPKELLRQILSVYLNLAPRDEFVKAIAADGRSYRKEIFGKACDLATRFMLKSPPEVDVLKNMVTRVEAVLQEEREEEEDLGEVPDEYTDPLMATVMRNPVKLPTSGAIIDLSTIKSHLLSDPTDPFNRAPLQLSEVQPADELRQEIEAWIKEKKAGRAAGKTG